MRIVFALMALAAQAFGQPPAIATQTLSNGMKLLVHQDHNIPNVALYFFFKIGSRNERPGTTGISHFFEHMMFNGAKKYGPKQFDIQMENRGGRNNAYTTRDVTVYTDWFPRDALELMFDMEGDRIGSLNLDSKMVESERGVVYSERRSSVDDSNFGALNELLDATVYLAHPYHWPVVGWASDIESWSMDDLKAHFRMGYAPNNCVVVAVGDVTADQVAELARKYFEAIPRQEPPPPVRTREPEQQGERRVTLSRPAQVPLQMIGYHIPRTADAEYYALEALRGVLAEGRSSRLYRRLVESDQTAIAVQANLEYSLDPGDISFVIQAKAGMDPARTERAFLEEVERIASGGVSAQELEKARNQWLARFYRQMETIAGKANLIGEYEVFFGDYRKLLTADQDFSKVRAAEVQAAARRYLDPKKKTVATLIPETREAAR